MADYIFQVNNNAPSELKVPPSAETRVIYHLILGYFQPVIWTIKMTNIDYISGLGCKYMRMREYRRWVQ